MASLASNDTLDTQTLCRLKREWLNRPEPQPIPQPDAGQEQPEMMIYHPFPQHAVQDGSMNADFTLSSQTPRQAAHSQDYVPPHLISSKYSPITHVAHDEHVHGNNMHYSSVGFEGDGAGDTQPMPTQTFMEYSDLGLNRSVMDANTFAAEGGRLVVAGSDALARQEQDVDLTDNDEDQLEDDDDVSSPNRTDELSPAAQARIRVAETAALFKTPHTPLTVSKKRNRHGEVISSEIRPPSTGANPSAVKAIFGGLGGIPKFSATQMFQQTQLDSSPPPNAPHSDEIAFARPSPSMVKRPSSPRDETQSSPIRPSTSDGLGNDPLSRYRTMKESQETRVRRQRLEEEQRIVDNFDDDLELDDSLAGRRKRMIRQREQQLLISNTDLRAPDPLFQLSRNERSRSVEYFSSELHMKTPVQRFAKLQPISPDSLSDMEEQLRLSDTIQENNIQLQIPGVQVPMTSSKPIRRTQSAMSQQPSPSSSQCSDAAGVLTQQTIAIQDSQSEKQSRPGVLNPSTHSGVPSSAISARLRVVQSPYPMLTSERRAILSQQLDGVEQPLPQLPVKFRNRATDDGAEIMPSSPPMFSEHDQEYDSDSDVEAVVGDIEMVDGKDEEGQQIECEVAGAGKEDIEDGIEMPDGVEEGVDLLPNAAPAPAPVSKPARSLRVRTNAKPAALKLMEDARISTASEAEVTSKDTNQPREQTTGINTGTELFETAATHETPASNNRVQQLAHSQQGSQVSPIKRVQDIAAAPSLQPSGESFDLDSVVDNIFTDGDRDFMKIIADGSPRPAKRARVYSGRRSILREPSLNANRPKASKAAKVIEAKESEVAETTPSPKSKPPLEVQEPAANNEAPMFTPGTPASVREREVEGAAAAMQARRLVVSRRIAPPAKSKKKKGKKQKTGMAARTTSRSRTAEPIEEAMQEEEKPKAAAQHVNLDNNRLITSPLSTSFIHTPLPTIQNTTVDSGTSSLRVLALFKGNSLYYYPATYLETMFSEGEKFRVRFTDGTIAVVDPMQVRSLELRVDDYVKVDRDGMRKGTYLVQGFDDNASGPITAFSDSLGHTALKLVPKTLDGATATQEPVVVPVENIYLTGGMLPTFADRKFVAPAKVPERFETPALQQISEPTTPGSRSRKRAFNLSVSGEPTTHWEPGLFSNMLFAVTFVNDNDPKHKDSIVKQLMSRGGRILDQGFDDIFESDAYMPSSPKKSPKRSPGSDDASKEPLRLQSCAQYLGFTAFIADKHCRKEKYLQALALGIPCLHHRWVTDCVAQETILPFERYLLPAGESEFLFGAVHSRILVPYAPKSDSASLQQVLSRRLLPLRDATVLLVMNFVNKCKTFQFLAYAAGARRVTSVRDLSEAKEAIAGGLTYDWVIGDDKTKARNILLSPNKEEPNKKKRTRDSTVAPSTEPQTHMKIADSEFLVQSLILGALADL